MLSFYESEEPTLPLIVVKAYKQYVYDGQGQEYLDCLSSVFQVGHCHSHVVDAAYAQMTKLSMSFGLLNDIHLKYLKRLVETLPEQLCTCFLLNSRAEANELAIRMAREFTKNSDIIIHKHSQYDFPKSKLAHDFLFSKKVHHIPLPDTYRGSYKEDNPHASYAYINDAKEIIKVAMENGRKIACFLSEIIMARAGVVVPPKGYFRNMYNYIREIGGLCIADETNTGLCRTGEHFWAFKMHDVIPDIVTIGQTLGSGHPVAAVFTSREIAEKMPEFVTSFGGNPVSCAIGLAVLDVIYNEKLQPAAKFVGQIILEELQGIKEKHLSIGEIRGIGMLIGIDFIEDQQSRKPAPDVAEEVVKRLLEEHIIARLDGAHKNVVVLSPPLCFTVENARCVVSALNKILISLERKESQESKENLQDEMFGI